MRTLLLVASLMFLMVEKSQAQIFVRNTFCGPAFAAPAGFGFSVRVGGLSIYAHSGLAPIGFGNPVVVGPAIVQKNIVWNHPWGAGWIHRAWWGPAPLVGPFWAGPVWNAPAWFGPWAWDPLGLPVWAPPGVLVPAGLAPLAQREQPLRELNGERPFEPAPLARRTIEPTPEFDEQRFIVIRPNTKPREPEVIVSKPAFPKLEPAANIPVVELPVVPVVAMIPERDPNQMEQDRLLEMGQEAFQKGQYGRAVERFRKAIEQNPKQAAPLFHLAQAYIALGKYRESAEAIRQGLKLRPNWLASGASPRSQYKNEKEYELHLQALAQVHQEFKNDRDVTLVYAFQLWFVGKKEQAQALLADLPAEWTGAFQARHP